MSPTTEVSFEDSHRSAKELIDKLGPHLGQISFGEDPRAFDKPTTEDPATLGLLVEAVTVFEGMPADHLVRLGRQAVAERNSDGMDLMDDEGQRRAIFAERFTLSLLSEEQREEVLGQ